MKTLKLFFASLLVLFVFSIPAVAVTVTGTGVPTIDVQAVQDAVDLGGTVTLSGIFDFGDDGSVEIGALDVEIIGDGTAKIIGGENPISCTTNKVNLAIKNLQMEEARWNAILVRKSSDLEISGCTIKNIRVADPFPGWYNFSVAIMVTTANPDLTTANLEDITGNVVIKNNDLRPNAVDDSAHTAIVQSGVIIQALNTDVNALVSQNEIHNCNAAGILIDQNEGLTTITDNTIIQDVGAYPSPARRGILIGHLAGPYLGIHQGDVYASGNDITLSRTNIYGVGIYVAAYLHRDDTDMLIENNTITASEPNFAIGIQPVNDNVENITCKSNIIDGTFYAVIYMPGHSLLSSKKITLVDNTITGTANEGIFLGVEESTIMNNDCSGLYAMVAQLSIPKVAHSNEIKNNLLGDLAPGAAAGIFCDGDDNLIVNNSFTGAYPGWEYDETTGDPGGPGCVLLSTNANDNHEVALKTDYPPGFDLCKQVLDLPDFENESYALYNPAAAIPVGSGLYLLPKDQVLTVGPYTFGSAGFDDKFGIDNSTTAFSFQREEPLPILTYYIDVGPFFLTHVNYMASAELVKTDKPYLTYTSGDWTVSYPDPTGNALTPYVLKNNKVPGYEKCLRKPDEFISAMQEKIAGLERGEPIIPLEELPQYTQ